MIKAKYTIIFGAITLLVVIIIIKLISSEQVVEKNYFEKASLTFGYYFSKVKETKGQPKEESWIESGGLYYKSLIYDGYEYLTVLIKEPDYSRDYTIDIVKITDQSYRIGTQKLGIGSTRKEIKKAYKTCRRISDLANENDIGFIDNGVWVVFSLAPDDTVAQIQIYYGP